MKTIIRSSLGVAVIMAMAILTACSGNTDTQTSGNTNTTQTTTTTTDTANTVVSADTTIILGNDSVHITEPGTYPIRGTLANGQIVVDAGSNNIVTLRLEGANITNLSGNAIFVKSGLVHIELAEGTTNTVTDAKNYSDQSDTAPNATIYAEENLTIYGNGHLTVNANYNDGITSKGTLIISSGNITVHAEDDAIRGKNALVVQDGTINIVSGGDGLKSDSENGGSITIENGNITIDAQSDGAQAYAMLTINGGSITITNSDEGLESEKIIINGGDISIRSTDDGINVSSSSSSEGSSTPVMGGSQAENHDIKLTINGGNITINADADGLDANGSIELNGGTVMIYGPTSSGDGALDYDATFKVTGGSLIAFGSAGMAQGTSSISTQASVLLNFSSTLRAGTTFTVTDTSGNRVIEATSLKDFASVVVSAPNMTLWETYSYTAGSESGTFTLSSVNTQAGAGGNMRGPGGGGMPPGNGMPPGMR